MKVDIDMNGSLNIWCETELELYALEKWDKENCIFFNHENGSPYIVKNMFMQCHEIMPEGLTHGWKEDRTKMFNPEIFDNIKKEKETAFKNRNSDLVFNLNKTKNRTKIE